jgi:hypothetical protein
MQNSNFPNGDLVTNEVEFNLDMLRALMLNGVGHHIENTGIITIDMYVVG